MTSYSDQLWIVMCNWSRFQHYRDREPPWIKNYTRLLSDPNYLALTPHQCAVLHRLWLEYARSGCQLRANTSSLSRQLGLRVTSRQLEALNHAGFLEFTLAPRYQSASDTRVHARDREELEQEQDLTNVRKEASYVAREERDDEDLSTIDYEQLLRSITDGP